MHVRFADQPIALVGKDRRLRRWFRRHFPPGHWSYTAAPTPPFGPARLWQFERAAVPLGGLPRFRWSQLLPPTWEPNRIWIPVGATRFSVGLLVLDNEAAISLYRKLDQDEGFFWLTIDGQAAIGAYRPIDIIPISSRERLSAQAASDGNRDQGLYLAVVVDPRWFWQHVIIPLHRPTTWGRILSTLESELNVRIYVDYGNGPIPWREAREISDFQADLNTTTSTSRICLPRSTSTSPLPTSTTTTTTTTSPEEALLPDPDAWTTPGEPATVILDAVAASLGLVVMPPTLEYETGGSFYLRVILSRKRFSPPSGLLAASGRSDWKKDRNPPPQRVRVLYPTCAANKAIIRWDAYEHHDWNGRGTRVYETTTCNCPTPCAEAIAQRIRKLIDALEPGLASGESPGWALATSPLGSDVDSLTIDIERGRCLLDGQISSAEPLTYAVVCERYKESTTTTPQGGPGRPPIDECAPCTCTWVCENGTAYIAENTCPDGCDCSPQPRPCRAGDQWSVVVPCTVTTPPPCTGGCIWLWDSELEFWGLYQNNCPDGCYCQPPQFCGGADCPYASTDCVRSEDLLPQPKCGTTTAEPTSSTSPGPTTSSTIWPPGHPCNPTTTTSTTTTPQPDCCCGNRCGCIWKARPQTGGFRWFLFSSTCCYSCPCQPPDRLPTNLCDVEWTPCAPPTTTPSPAPCIPCGGYCTWVWQQDWRRWVLVDNRCRTYWTCPCPDGSPCRECRCRPPSAEPEDTPHAPWVTRCECVCPTTTPWPYPCDPPSTTPVPTTTSPPPACGRPCIVKWDGQTWSGGNCPPECPCLAPPFPGTVDGECRESVCAGTTSSTTSTAPPTTTSSTTTTTTTRCPGNCVYVGTEGGPILLQNNCEAGCFCEPAPCTAVSPGDTVVVGCLYPQQAQTTTSCQCFGYCEYVFQPEPRVFRRTCSPGCTCQQLSCNDVQTPIPLLTPLRVPCVPPPESTTPCPCDGFCVYEVRSGPDGRRRVYPVSHSCRISSTASFCGCPRLCLSDFANDFWGTVVLRCTSDRSKSDRQCPCAGHCVWVAWQPTGDPYYVNWIIYENNCSDDCVCNPPSRPPYHVNDIEYTDCVQSTTTTPSICEGLPCAWRWNPDRQTWELIRGCTYPGCICPMPMPYHGYDWRVVEGHCVRVSIDPPWGTTGLPPVWTTTTTSGGLPTTTSSAITTTTQAATTTTTASQPTTTSSTTSSTSTSTTTTEAPTTTTEGGSTTYGCTGSCYYYWDEEFGYCQLWYWTCQGDCASCPEYGFVPREWCPQSVPCPAYEP